MKSSKALLKLKLSSEFSCDGVTSKTTKEKVKSSALKSKDIREQTSGDSDSQGGSDEDIDEEETEAFNLLARNFHKFYHKGNRFGLENQLGNGELWKQSGFTKHMTKNGRLFTSYKAYDGAHVVFGSNLKAKIIGGVSFSKVDCTISKSGKMLAKGHMRN
nr:hypothetical protein [Tanacetum cinerariifolium]